MLEWGQGGESMKPSRARPGNAWLGMLKIWGCFPKGVRWAVVASALQRGTSHSWCELTALGRPDALTPGVLWGVHERAHNATFKCWTPGLCTLLTPMLPQLISFKKWRKTDGFRSDDRKQTKPHFSFLYTDSHLHSEVYLELLVPFIIMKILVRPI